MTRPVLSLLLSALVLMTSISTAMARGAAPAADSLVICSAHGFEVIYLDAEGNETRAPHLCPDCLMHLSGLVSTCAAVQMSWDAPAIRVRPHRAAQLTSVVAVFAMARAPPGMM